MKPFPIAPHSKAAAILLGISWTIVGCTQAVAPQAEKAQPSPESTPISEPETKPVPVRSLTTTAKPVKEQKLAESKSEEKPIANRALLFSCRTENGKEILLYQTDDTIDYSFGNPDGKPELELKVERDQASTFQWKGIGHWMSYAVEVPNGDVVYSVFWGADRISEKHEIEAGVRVRSNGKILTTVFCSDKIINHLQGVKLKPTV